MEKLEFLGTGTSTGLPVPGCRCRVCRSEDPRDTRLRSSIFWHGMNVSVLVDSGPDLRQQLLRSRITHIDLVLITHTHADHIHGIDDLRTLSYRNPQGSIPLYASPEDCREIRRRFDYIFPENPGAGHGGGRPHLSLHSLEAFQPVQAGDLTVTALPVWHGRSMVYGYLFETRDAAAVYLTDISTLPDDTLAFLQKRPLDLLVIDGLRPSPHPTHFSFSEALEAAHQVAAGSTYITHLSDEVTHVEAEGLLGPAAQPAYDGLVVEVGNGETWGIHS